MAPVQPPGNGQNEDGRRSNHEPRAQRLAASRLARLCRAEGNIAHSDKQEQCELSHPDDELPARCVVSESTYEVACPLLDATWAQHLVLVGAAA